ncbi:MAG TPA: hypothetical protein QGH10_23555 [Armatimonadota bacterium]|nr:hypothetical protein [Armatimonadota bacterium]
MRACKMPMVLVALVTFAVLAGCGGSNGQRLAAEGPASVQVQWSDEIAVRPVGAHQISIECRIVELAQTGLRELGFEWMNFPNTNLNFGNLPAGDFVLEAKSYDQPDLLGNVVNELHVPVTIRPRVNNDILIATGGEAASITPFPLNLRLFNNEEADLFATVRNKQNTPLMTPAGLINWSVINNNGRVDLKPGGHITVLKDIPIVSRLFAQVNYANERRELLIILTPRIIR